MKKRTKTASDSEINGIDQIAPVDDQGIDPKALDWFSQLLSRYSYGVDINKDMTEIKKLVKYACGPKKWNVSQNIQERDSFFTSICPETDDGPSFQIKSMLLPREVAKITDYIIQDISQAQRFAHCFSFWGVDYCLCSFDNEKLDSSSVNVAPLKRKRQCVDSFVESSRSNHEDWNAWLYLSLTPCFISPDLSAVRNWIHCFMPQNASVFDSRIWNPIREYKNMVSRISDSSFRKIPSKTELNEGLEVISEVNDFLSVLKIAIANVNMSFSKEALNVSQDVAHDPSRVPERLLLMAEAIRRAGREVTTEELKKWRIDPGIILAPSKGCSQKDQEWAEKHLKAERGLWKWNPPKLPSEKK